MLERPRVGVTVPTMALHIFIHPDQAIHLLNTTKGPLSMPLEQKNLPAELGLNPEIEKMDVVSGH